MNTQAHEAGAPVLVLANSLSATQEMWFGQVPSWSGRHRVISFNYAGHGPATETSLPPVDTIAGMGQALIARLDQMGVQQFDFVGLSLGGMLGLHLASEYPDRVHRLVAANCRYWNNPEGQKQWDLRIQAVREGGMQAIAQGTLERWFTAGFRDAEPDTVARMRDMILQCDVEGYALAATAVRNLDLRDQLANIRCPVLLLTGDQDVAAPADHMQEIANMVANASLHVFDDCAHISNIEHPKAFLERVQEHLGSR